jgi:hypothetical protein
METAMTTFNQRILSFFGKDVCIIDFVLLGLYLQTPQPMSMVLPKVVGFKLSGKLRDGVTAADLALTVAQMLRKNRAYDKFVEFYGTQISMTELCIC